MIGPANGPMISATNEMQIRISTDSIRAIGVYFRPNSEDYLDVITDNHLFHTINETSCYEERKKNLEAKITLPSFILLALTDIVKLAYHSYFTPDKLNLLVVWKELQQQQPQ